MTTANVGVIEGGVAINVVPEWCTVRGEARSRDEERLARQIGRNACFLAALLDQVLEQPQPRGLATGDCVVELAGEGGLLVRTPRHPEMQAVAPADVARHVRSVGAHAEPWHGRALHAHQRRIAELPGYGILLFAPQLAEQATLAKTEQKGTHSRRALVRRVERSFEKPAAVAMAEKVGAYGDHGQKVAMQEAGAHRANEPRFELGEVGVVAAFDMVEEGHRRGR